MNRLVIAIFSLALIFTLSPLHTTVKAEESQKNVEETVKSIEKQVKESTTNQVTETKMEVHRKSVDKGNHYTFTAKLKDVKDAEGIWTLFVDGKKYDTKKSKKPSVSLIYNLYDEYKQNGETKGHEFKIVFEGKADGKVSKAEATQSLADLTVIDSQDGDTYIVKGTLTSGQNAKGNWGIEIDDEKGEKVIQKKEVYNKKGTSFSHTFTGLKEGSYLVYFAYDGKVDGEGTVIKKKEKLEIKAKNNDNGDVKPTPVDNKPEPTPVDNKPEPTPVDNKPEPTPVDNKPEPTPVDNKPAVQQVIDNTHKGGQMPKTASSNPVGMVSGLILLTLGGTVLGYRRFVK